MQPGTRLPIDPASCGKIAQGFCTPKEDTLPQIVSIHPKRVLPIIFLPGIMGSNLRMTAERQAELGKSNNIAWRPDDLVTNVDLLRNGSPARRQAQLDPDTTEVDIYDPAHNPTGNANETADQRNSNVKVSIALNVGIDTPLLMDDPVTYKNRKTKEQKARERGWGEVFYDSYRDLLEMCELRLNSAFYRGTLNPWWKQIVGVAPSVWQASPQSSMSPLAEAELKAAIKGCWFPVHAMGYNWLQSNMYSAATIAKRVKELIARYQSYGYDCEKVIIVTHSMGGLVARALIHPEMGNLNDKILGIVHGVMPATGAAAAYKRMRCGFEYAPIDPTPNVLGGTGRKVTAVLGNAQGGLELLPSQAYGNGWLQVRHNDRTLVQLPQHGDPYEEIYKLRGKWYGLLNEDWLNPAHLEDRGRKNSAQLLDGAKAFHVAIADTYHANSFAHYGADAQHAAWHNVVWELEAWARVTNVESLNITHDNETGRLQVVDPAVASPAGATVPGLAAVMLPPTDPGDQTVPTHSADHQLLSGKFKGIFRQTGYEHQNSYQDQRALHSTLYSLVKIAATMSWDKS